MKNLLLSLAVLSAFALSSCNSVSPEMPPTYGGQIIFSNVSAYHAIASEPANVAFRLLIWIKDGKSMEDDNFKKLFGNLTSEDIVETNGVYTITYPSNYNNDYDIRKGGQITIDTHNNTLESNGDDWIISILDNPLKLISRSQNGYNDIEYTFDSYNGTITSSDMTDWRIEAVAAIDWPKVQGETPQLSWTIDNVLSLTPGDGTTTFDHFVKGALNVEVYSSEQGSMSVYDQVFSWTVDETLTYKMSCTQQNISAPYISQGSLSMSFNSSDPITRPIDPQTFPSKEVNVSFSPIEGRCGAAGLLKYNGYQLNF